MDEHRLHLLSFVRERTIDSRGCRTRRVFSGRNRDVTAGRADGRLRRAVAAVAGATDQRAAGTSVSPDKSTSRTAATARAANERASGAPAAAATTYERTSRVAFSPATARSRTFIRWAAALACLVFGYRCAIFASVSYARRGSCKEYW